MQMTKSFHNLADRSMRAYQNYTAGGWMGGTYISFLNRSMTYQFFPHFHPYVGGNRTSLPDVPSSWLSLIQRLQEGGVGELLDSDTLYMPQPNPSGSQALQPLTVIPDSTRAILSQNTPGTRPDGTTVSLLAGTPVTLAHLTNLVLPDPT